jgi:urea transport system substrate-binding protein
VVDATLLAIEEINARGGLLNHRVLVPVVADGASDWPTFARETRRLIDQEKVQVIFGCWTSASRKTVRPVLEAADHLLFYPVQYEGLETSPNIFDTGAAPNQQIIPAVKWAHDKLGKRFFLVGSDYVFPRTANAIIRDQVRALRGEIVGEAYLPLGGTAAGPVIEQILAARPDVILNTINGDSNVAFFAALRAAGITTAKIPTISFSISENELIAMDRPAMAGDYAAWNYFQSLPGEENQQFIKRFRARFGATRVISDPMEAAYFGVNLWAQAVVEAGDPSPRATRVALRDQSLNAPEGVVLTDPDTQHTWRNVRIGQIRADGQFDIVWDSGKPVRPVPYPIYRSPQQWNDFLNALYQGWGGRWSAPAPAP